MTSPASGARTSIRRTSSAEVAGVSGVYFAQGRARRPSASSYDVTTAARVWQVSHEQLVDLPA